MITPYKPLLDVPDSKGSNRIYRAYKLTREALRLTHIFPIQWNIALNRQTNQMTDKVGFLSWDGTRSIKKFGRITSETNIFEVSKRQDYDYLNDYFNNETPNMKIVARLLELSVNQKNTVLVDLILNRYADNNELKIFFSALRNQEGKDILQQSNESRDFYGYEVWKKVGLETENFN